MTVTDPIADLLTRIRNAQMARHRTVRIPGSQIKWAIARILEDHGYVESSNWLAEGHQGIIEVELRYDNNGIPMIRGIQRESKPGQRVFVKKDEIPQVLNGLGIAILSTSKGVMDGDKAKAASTGGELLATVW
ncbi:MAG: 30S ribosomal protein S8 [Myxococcota bacterium]